MALKAMVKSLDGITEAHRALYRKDGEGDKAVFVLDVEPAEGFALENVTGLKSTIQKLRDSEGEKEQRLAAFKDLDPTTARDALKKVEQMKHWSSDDKVREQVDQHGKQVAAAKDAEIAALNQKLANITKGYEAATVERALIDAAQKAKFVAPNIAARLFRDAVKLDDKLQPVVIGADGKARQVVNNDGTSRNMTIEEYVAEQAKQDEYKPLVAGNGATGSKGSEPRTGTQQPATAQRLNPVEVNQQLEQALAGRAR